MPAQNVENVRRLYAAMEDRDEAAVVPLVHPDAEWIPDWRLGEDPIRGRDNVVRFFFDMDEMFGALHSVVEGIWENDDKVLVFLRVTGRGAASGAEFDIRIAHLLTLDQGVVVRAEGYGNREEAREAAGRTEE